MAKSGQPPEIQLAEEKPSPRKKKNTHTDTHTQKHTHTYTRRTACIAETHGDYPELAEPKERERGEEGGSSSVQNCIFLIRRALGSSAGR